MKTSEDLTATWRGEDSAPQHFDAALQLVRYRRQSSSANPSSSARTAAADPEERKNLIKGLSNPLLYHRHSQCLSRLQDHISSLGTARRLVGDAKSTDKWKESVALAIECAERAWDKFIHPLVWMNQRRYVEGGDTGGMWKEEKRCKLAIELKLLELEKEKGRCISAIQQMCWMDEQGWSSAERVLLSMMAYNSGLAELIQFATLLTTIDKSLKSAIDVVAKKMVAKGKRMHELKKQDEALEGDVASQKM
ncbi:hypothetical protein QFC22_004761 [Naganishia vaughanmartiniae]|uniref:Uncharacterized protein n=1 Tax=Naganishia vaughanmartiniae TaxID=1424756 RepID=A0ACC2WZU3_9TREE|nr:hypothetical protein QFC22_004761 [Naganishia vaughanmartiniae]